MRWFAQVRLFGIAVIYWLLVTFAFLAVLLLHPAFSPAGQAAAQSSATRIGVPSETIAQSTNQYTPPTAKEQAVVQAYLAAVGAVDSSSRPPTVMEVVTSGQYALLDWTLGETGGQAVLTLRSGQWQLIRGTGGVFDRQTLQGFGLSASDAQALLDAYHRVNP
jgi:hypothetical protein